MGKLNYLKQRREGKGNKGLRRTRCSHEMFLLSLVRLKGRPGVSVLFCDLT